MTTEQTKPIQSVELGTEEETLQPINIEFVDEPKVEEEPSTPINISFVGDGNEDTKETEEATEEATEETPVIKTTKRTTKAAAANAGIATFAMTVNKTETEYKAFINTIASGRTSRDIIKKVSDYKGLNFTEAQIKSQLDSYQNNIGAFLEARSVIPTYTGIMFNEIQAGHTYKDAIRTFATQYGITDTYYKKMLDELSKGGIYGVCKAIQNGQISIPNNPTTTNLKMQWKTDTEIKVNTWVTLKPLLFSGLLSTSYPVYIAITPVNCQFRGVKAYVSSQNPNTTYSSKAQFGTFNNMNTLNNTFSSLAIYVNGTSHKTDDVYMTVQVVNNKPTSIPTDYRFNNIIKS